MSRPKGSKNKIKGNGTKQALLSTPSTNYTNFLPTWYVINPTPEKIILPWERRQQIQLGRELYAKMPIVNAAITNKNHIAVGDAWQPTFAGNVRNDTDKQWIEAAVKWMVNDYYPNVNWMGNNFSFQDSLFLTGKDIDVDGGSLMLYRKTKGGLPRVQFLPTDRIGTRDMATVVKGGKYDGYKIYDGVIFNGDNMPIALNILGETEDDDTQISLFNCQYLYEPSWDGAVHGVSKIANAVTNLMDVKDINDLLKITVKKLSTKAIIHKSSLARMAPGKRGFGQETPITSNSVSQTQPGNRIFYESVNGGTTDCISSIDGSEITPFNFDSPSPNTEGFIFRISSEAIASLGWFIELVTPSKLSGTSVRLIQDQARKLIVWRQQTMERRAKAMVAYGLATAMQLGLVPMTDNKDWMKWNFSKPSLLTVDSGYDNQAQIESLKMGISTKEEICAKRGSNWQDVSNQSELELRDLFIRAKKLAADFNISEAEAREWLSKRDIDVIAPQLPNGEGVAEQKTETTNETNSNN